MDDKIYQAVGHYQMAVGVRMRLEAKRNDLQKQIDSIAPLLRAAKSREEDLRGRSDQALYDVEGAKL